MDNRNRKGSPYSGRDWDQMSMMGDDRSDQLYFGNLGNFESRTQAITPERLGSRSTYAGRGPKSYRKSDERLKEIACDRLCDDPLVDASNIEVSVTNSEIRLSGTVPDRFSKRRAEDVVEGVIGINHVENLLRIDSQQPRPTPSDLTSRNEEAFK